MPLYIVHNNHQVERCEAKNFINGNSIWQPKLVYDDIRTEFTYSFSNIEIKDKRYFAPHTTPYYFSVPLSFPGRGKIGCANYGFCQFEMRLPAALQTNPILPENTHKHWRD